MQIFSRKTDTASISRRLPTTVLFAGLAMASAFACYLSITFASDFLPFGFGLSGQSVTIIPGMIFGTLVAACDYFFGARDRFRLALVIGLTTVGWIAAVDSTMTTFKALSGDQWPSATTETPPIAAYIGGLVGGAVGGGLTILGLWISNRNFRRLEAWSLSWGTATIAGATLGLLDLNRDFSYWILFSVWQTALIVSMVRGFAPESAKPIAWRRRGSTG